MLYNKDKSSSIDQTSQSCTGRFISFEGIDGSGKTTQITLLAARLQSCGIRVKTMREPGGTAIGEEIRRILLDHKHADMHIETELLLFSAARAQLVREIILPALKAGIWIISDRFYDSTVAYQGYGRGLNLDMIHAINGLASAQCKPNVTVLLDLPADTACSRLSARVTSADRIDCESLSFMDRTRRGYLKTAENEPERFIVVDAGQNEEQLAQKIYSEIREGFGI